MPLTSDPVSPVAIAAPTGLAAKKLRTPAIGVLTQTQSWLLSLYLGTAPVRWLPGVDYEVVTRGKVILFVVAVGSVLLCRSPGRLRLPGGLAGPLGFAGIAVLCVPGFVQSSQVDAAAYLADLVYGAIMLWCFYNVTRTDDVETAQVLERSAVLIGVLALIASLAATAGLGWQAPCSVSPLAATGFGCGRTAWSQGIALYLPIMLVFLFRRDVSVLRRWLYAGLGFGIVAAQLGVGGRAGLAASFVVGATMAFFFMPRRWKVLAATALLLLIAAVAVPKALEEHLRLDRIPAGPVTFTDLDWFSAGRLGGAVEAFGHIAERPLTGHGIGAVDVGYRGTRSEIHNMWLKWAAYLGIGAPVFLLALAFILLKLARQLTRLAIHRRSVAAAAGLIVVSGLVISMLAPSTPVGAFQDSAIWWAAAGLIMGMAAGQPESATRRGPHPLKEPNATVLAP